jgi:hypothetical protein
MLPSLPFFSSWSLSWIDVRTCAAEQAVVQRARGPCALCACAIASACERAICATLWEPATCEPCHILAELYVVLLDARDQVLYRSHAGAGAAPASCRVPCFELWHAPYALDPAQRLLHTVTAVTMAKMAAPILFASALLAAASSWPPVAAFLAPAPHRGVTRGCATSGVCGLLALGRGEEHENPNQPSTLKPKP